MKNFISRIDPAVVGLSLVEENALKLGKNLLSREIALFEDI